MEMDKLNKIVLLLSFLCFFSCTNIYEKSLSDILCLQDVNIISSKRYESLAIGEWYVLEKYTLSSKCIQESLTRIPLAPDMCVREYKINEKSYMLGWYPLSDKSPYYNLLAQSTGFHADKTMLREYNLCCQENHGFYAIIVRDTSALHDDFTEKIVIVMDTCQNDVYICNYHY